jgi:Na+/proline symporter
MPLPDSARPYRAGMWVLLVLGLALLALALAGLKRVVPPAVGALGITGFFACILMALLFGLRARRATMEDRTRTAATGLLVMMAGMLKQQDDATLESIAAKGGPAGAAAALLLEKRKAGK